MITRKQLVQFNSIQTSANAVRYSKTYYPEHVINIHPQLFQFVFNVLNALSLRWKSGKN